VRRLLPAPRRVGRTQPTPGPHSRSLASSAVAPRFSLSLAPTPRPVAPRPPRRPSPSLAVPRRRLAPRPPRRPSPSLASDLNRSSRSPTPYHSSAPPYLAHRAAARRSSPAGIRPPWHGSGTRRLPAPAPALAPAPAPAPAPVTAPPPHVAPHVVGNRRLYREPRP